MKKLICLLVCLMLVLTTGCEKNTTKNNDLNMKAEEIIEKIYEGIDEEKLPALGNIEIDKENMSYYLGVEDLDIVEGIASEPMISSIAWSVVVVKVADGVDVNAAKTKIKENVNPAKWLCVDAEEVYIENKGNTIILIMMDELNLDIAKTMEENAKKL